MHLTCIISHALYWYQFCLELQTRETPKQNPELKDQEKLYDTGEVPLSRLKTFKVMSLFKKLVYEIIYNELSPI